MKFRAWIFGLSMFPLVSGLIVLFWAIPRYIKLKNFAPELRSYGLIPWLEMPRVYSHAMVQPIGLLSTVAISLFVIWVFWKMLNSTTQASDLNGLCLNCGYQIAPGLDHCSECGRAYPDPIVENRKSQLGRIHRTLIVSILLTGAVPGMCFWILLSIRWFYPALEEAYGSNLNFAFIVSIGACVCVASILSGVVMNLYYVRKYKQQQGGEENRAVKNTGRVRFDEENRTDTI